MCVFMYMRTYVSNVQTAFQYYCEGWFLRISCLQNFQIGKMLLSVYTYCLVHMSSTFESDE